MDKLELKLKLQKWIKDGFQEPSIFFSDNFFLINELKEIYFEIFITRHKLEVQEQINNLLEKTIKNETKQKQ